MPTGQQQGEPDERRYSEFISYYKWQFRSRDVIAKYLEFIQSVQGYSAEMGMTTESYTYLETVHYEAFTLS
jgi:hypothetical protein